MPEATGNAPVIKLTPPQDDIGPMMPPQLSVPARDVPSIPPHILDSVDTAEAEATHRPAGIQSKRTTFEHRYPPDRIGEEAGDKARVWPMYRERVTELDDDMLEGWNDTLNVLLVFAGLFSAACTAFLIEIYKTLQPDWQQATAIVVYALHNNLNATATPITVSNPSDFTVQNSARWINILWFTSLTFSLIASLLAILAKQWLAEYKTRMRAPAASPRAWALRHVSSRRALDAWGMNGFISTLPLLLHASLFLFLVGLSLLMMTIDRAIGGVVVGLTFIVTAFYVAAAVAPAIWGDCPTVTPALRQACRLWDKLPAGWIAVASHGMPRWQPRFSSAHDPSYDIPQREADTLSWMIRTLPNAEDIRTALCAIGGLSPRVHHPYFSENGRRNPLLDEDILSKSASTLRDASMNPVREEDTTISCIMRGILFQGRDIRHVGTEHADRLVKRCHTLPFDADILCLPLDEIERRWLDAPTVGSQAGWHVHSVDLILWSMRGRPVADRVLLLIALLVRMYSRRVPQSESAWLVLRALEAEARGIAGPDSRWQPPHSPDYAVHVVSVLDALMFYQIQRSMLTIARARRAMRAVRGDFVRRARITPVELDNMSIHFIFMSHDKFRTHTITTADLNAIGQFIFLSRDSSSTIAVPENTGAYTFNPLNSGIVAIHFNLVYQLRARKFQPTPATRAWMERPFVQSTSPIALIHGVTSPNGALCSHLELLRPRSTPSGEVTSSWKMMYQLIGAEIRPILAVYAFSLSTQVYALHRGGATVLAQELLYQLMSHTCGISLLCRSLLWREHLALHAKRVSPGWWAAARDALLQIDSKRWLSSPGANTPSEFVGKLDTRETCSCDNITVDPLDMANAATSSASLVSSLQPGSRAQELKSLALVAPSGAGASQSARPHSRRWREALKTTLPTLRLHGPPVDLSSMLELGQVPQLGLRGTTTGPSELAVKSIPALAPHSTNSSSASTSTLERHSRSSEWSKNAPWSNGQLESSSWLDGVVESSHEVSSLGDSSATLAREPVELLPRTMNEPVESKPFGAPEIVVEDYDEVVTAKT